MVFNAQAQINGAALEHNLSRVKQLAPQAKILAMVKSNGYGHGVATVVNYLERADAFGLARLGEATRLRELGVKKPLVLMEGFLQQDELQAIDKYHLEVVIHQPWQVEMLEAYQFKKPVKVWLKVNTGMHRLGVEPEMCLALFQRLKASPQVDDDIHLMTHFACADERDSVMTRKQMTLFYDLVKELSSPRSLANSAGIIAWPDSHSDWVRPGLMLYGASPFSDKTAEDLALKPAMTLTSKLIAINKICKGQTVGYGATWTAPEDMVLGVVAIGYGDGYPRYARNGTPVLVAGHSCSLVGRVSMDMLTVDLRSYIDAKVGDNVTLWGEGLPVETIALWADTVPYTLLTGITSRVDYQIVN